VRLARQLQRLATARLAILTGRLVAVEALEHRNESLGGLCLLVEVQRQASLGLMKRADDESECNFVIRYELLLAGGRSDGLSRAVSDGPVSTWQGSEKRPQCAELHDCG